jgi:hypothetical protein
VRHVKFPHACENVNEISQVPQVDSVLDNCVRDDGPRDSGTTDVPSIMDMLMSMLLPQGNPPQKPLWAYRRLPEMDHKF